MALHPFFLALAVIAPLSFAPPAMAEAQVSQTTAAAVGAFSQTLMVAQILDVIRAEGLAQSDELTDALFPGQSPMVWQTAVSQIYDTGAMKIQFDAALATAVADDATTLAGSQQFFGSDLGQKILGLELGARRALLDKTAEAAAKRAWEQLVRNNARRADQIIRFGSYNDLIESNVMGALNANLAFYRGMSAEGAFGDPMSEADMLAEVWGQEAAIRRETTDWLYPFLALSYQRLSDAELDSYIAFSETDAGKKINAAIFVAFDEVMAQISEDLGRAAGQLMAGQDI